MVGFEIPWRSELSPLDKRYMPIKKVISQRAMGELCRPAVKRATQE